MEYKRCSSCIPGLGALTGFFHCGVGQDPFKAALEHKVAGNEHFKAGRYEQAIECYTTAIRVCPDAKISELATFFQNRAAAYENLKNYVEVIADCNSAVKLNGSYVKALVRRARAYEAVNDLYSSLEDMTAVCILERFENMSSLQTTDRILKKFSKERAKKLFKTQIPTLPSKHFITNYFSSFKEDPIYNEAKRFEKEVLPELYKPQTLRGYQKVLYLLVKKEYDQVVEAASEEIDENGNKKAEALLARGSMTLLYGKNEEALKDFTRLLKLDKLRVNIKVIVNALIKVGTIKMQHEMMSEALKNFEEAIQLDAYNADVYMHRGQVLPCLPTPSLTSLSVYLLMDKINETLADMEKSAALNPDSPSALAQQYYVQFRCGLHYNDVSRQEQAMQGFEKLHKRFPNSPEPFFLYGQVSALLVTGKEKKDFEKSQEFYRQAMRNDPEDANIIIHYGLLFIHWKQDIEQALQHLNVAIRVDPKCQFAYETLGTIEVQRGNLERGMELFDSAIKLARSENELAHLLSLREAARAQTKVSKRLGLTQGIFAGSGESN
ncbi:TOMM70A [Cordylochernes scorpioides]|uniref:TOMM70A n=1 Tax=Cordylochernes scorpioides TaxID=51811 RepID=A0ABY6KRR5_9ARAC|nr:TOMM70A [Cordylochernes scorpioides]